MHTNKSMKMNINKQLKVNITECETHLTNNLITLNLLQTDYINNRINLNKLNITLNQLYNRYNTVSISQAMWILEKHICYSIVNTNIEYYNYCNFEKINNSKNNIKLKIKLQNKLNELKLTNKHLNHLEFLKESYIPNYFLETRNEWNEYIIETKNIEFIQFKWIQIDLLNVLEKFNPIESMNSFWKIEFQIKHNN